MLTFQIICAVGVVVGLLHATFTAYISGRNNKPIESWVYSWEFAPLVIAETGAVTLSLVWGAWNVHRFLWWTILLSLLTFFVIFVLPMLVREDGLEEHKKELKEREDAARRSH